MRFTARTFRRAFVGAVAITVAVLGYGEVFMSQANCSKPIFAAELSQGVIGAPQARAHLVCYRAWLLEVNR